MCWGRAGGCGARSAGSLGLPLLPPSSSSSLQDWGARALALTVRHCGESAQIIGEARVLPIIAETLRRHTDHAQGDDCTAGAIAAIVLEHRDNRARALDAGIVPLLDMWLACPASPRRSMVDKAQEVDVAAALASCSPTKARIAMARTMRATTKSTFSHRDAPELRATL